MAERIFYGDYSDGNIHFFVGELVGEGAETDLHAHHFDHTMRVWVHQQEEGAELEVYARRSDGSEVLVDWQLVAGQFKRALIRAGVHHRLRLTKGQKVWYECAWSHWQPVGDQIVRLADPKVAAGWNMK